MYNNPNFLSTVELPEKNQQVFEANLAAFAKYHPKIYRSLQHLKNNDSERHIFYTSTGLLDVIPAGFTKPLYSDDPYKESLMQVVRFTKKPEFTSFTFKKNKRLDDTRAHIRFMNSLIDIQREALTESACRLTVVPEKYQSVVVFGVGLGYHIELLFKLHQFQHCFICEPDFQLFYLSTYVIPWAGILEQAAMNQAHIHFQLALGPDEYITELLRLTEYYGPHILVSAMLYQHYASAQLNTVISAFYSRLHEIQRNFSFYNDAINGLAHLNQHLVNSIPIMSDVKAPLISQCPVFVVGNGPSLDDAIDFLKHNQKNAVIIAAGTALATLLKMGIKPDFHVLVERTKVTFDFLVRTLPAEAYKDINLLTVDVMHSDVPPLYKWAGLTLKGPEASSALASLIAKRQNLLPPKVLSYSGPLVSNTALSYAIELGFKNIYLFGIDNGSVGEKSHSINSVYYDEKFKFGNSVLKNNIYKLEGNFGTTILANSLLARSRSNIDLLLSNNNDRNFYHVGIGARLNHATPILIADMAPARPINKEKLIEELKSHLFAKLSVNSLVPYITFNDFETLCDELISLSSRQLNSRSETAGLLDRQRQVINRYLDLEQLYLYRIIVGSFNYFSSLLIQLGFSLEDEDISLVAVCRAVNEWIEFLKFIKADFAHSWDKKCEVGFV